MSELVNLRRVKKAKARAAAAAEADANRVKHGTPTFARKLASSKEKLHARQLEGHRLSDQDEPK